MTTEQRTRIEEILRTLDQFPVPKELINRRHSPRLKVRTSLTSYLLAVPGYPAIQIHTRNICTSGIGFVSRRPFRRGEFLAVELYMLPHLSKLILCETTFSRYVRDGMYDIGCVFQESIRREEIEARYTRERIPPAWVEKGLPAHAVK